MNASDLSRITAPSDAERPAWREQVAKNQARFDAWLREDHDDVHDGMWVAFGDDKPEPAGRGHTVREALAGLSGPVFLGNVYSDAPNSRYETSAFNDHVARRRREDELHEIVEMLKKMKKDNRRRVMIDDVIVERRFEELRRENESMRSWMVGMSVALGVLLVVLVRKLM